MSKQSIAFLKSRFQTGDKPTEQDFIDEFESYVHYTQNGTLFRVSKQADDADYTEIQAAHDALPSTGGIIYVDGLKSGDSDYQNFTITKANVSIIGESPSEIDFSTGLLSVNGVRIEGTCLLRANNCSVSNISVHTVNTAADCMRWGNAKNNGTLLNCRFLGKDKLSAFHCLLIEGYSNVYVGEIKTYRNVWGVAIKDSFIQLNGHYGKDHNNGPIITKADNGNTIRNINVSNSVFQGANAGAYYVQSVLSSTLYDVNYTNCTAFNASFLYSLEAGSTIEGVTYTGCKTRDAGNNSWQFFGTSESEINLIGCSGTGAPTNSVFMDDSVGHTNIVYSGCHFDKPVQGSRSSSRATEGLSATKIGVLENTATDICKIHHEDIDSLAYNITIISNSTATQSCSVWLYTSAFSNDTTTMVQESKFGVSTITLTATLDTVNNELTINVQVDQTSLTEDMRIECQIQPLAGRDEFIITRL